MTRPHTPPRDLDDAVDAARGIDPWAAYHARHERAARRALALRIARAAAVCALAVTVIALGMQAARPHGCIDATGCDWGDYTGALAVGCLPPGLYEVRGQREHDPYAALARKVMD